MTTLSPRELEVARLVGEDLSDKEIAAILRISIRTVQRHLERMVDKIGAKGSTLSRRRAIRRWVEVYEDTTAKHDTRAA